MGEVTIKLLRVTTLNSQGIGNFKPIERVFFGRLVHYQVHNSLINLFYSHDYNLPFYVKYGMMIINNSKIFQVELIVWEPIV